MKAFVLVAALALALVPATSAAGPNPARSSGVQEWTEVALAEIAAHRTNPPRAARLLAHLSAASYAAAVLGDGETIDGAASSVLSHFYPDRAAAFAALGTGDARGRRIGAALVARAQTDGSAAVWSGTVPVGTGLWAPTPPAFAPAPLEPLAGTWRTWNLDWAGQFRPGPPPAPGSALWQAELQEVYDVSQSRTDEQAAIALFWADGAGTVTPPGHWNRLALDLIAAKGMSDVRAAQVLATLNTAQADAFIACWEAKFTYWSERPVTAIRRTLDPAWSSLIVTPPFPSYVSGHSSTSGAASTVLSHFFPDERDELAALAAEAAVSRLYGGIHFASDNEAGLQLGQLVGREALRGRAWLLIPPR
jgi:membrane-associated phospholipid phosphatase